jgi:hypothetical protein
MHVPRTNPAAERRRGDLGNAFERLRQQVLPLATVSAWADVAIAAASTDTVSAPVDVVEHVSTLYTQVTAAVDALEKVVFDFDTQVAA